MPEDDKQQRPVRKLTVKNFSVIKEAELEFGKITVLIGPQSSGKSLLCKLAHYLSKEAIEVAVTSVLSGISWDKYVVDLSKAFSSRFFTDYEFVSGLSEISLTENEFRIDVDWPRDSNNPRFRFCEAFKYEFDSLANGQSQTVPAPSGAYLPQIRRRDVWTRLFKLASGEDYEGPVYIPAGRAFFTNAPKGFAALQNPAIDQLTREFSSHIIWDSRWKNGLLTSGRGITDEIDRFMTRIAGGYVTAEAGQPRFLTDDGRKLPLEIVSTGIQELAPLFNILEQLMFFREHSIEAEQSSVEGGSEPPVVVRPVIYIEEPEANIFPKSQYDLVRLFAWLASDPILNFKWVITTHSPYILSVLGDLVKAGLIASKEPERRTAVAQIISESFWINPEDFAAYKIEDGKLQSIFDKDSGQIDGDYLDDVSGKISDEFGQLLEIQYGK